MWPVEFPAKMRGSSLSRKLQHVRILEILRREIKIPADHNCRINERFLNFWQNCWPYMTEVYKSKWSKIQSIRGYHLSFRIWNLTVVRGTRKDRWKMLPRLTILGRRWLWEWPIKPGRRNELIGICRIDVLRLTITDITGTARNKLLKIPWGLIHCAF